MPRGSRCPVLAVGILNGTPGSVGSGRLSARPRSLLISVRRTSPQHGVVTEFVSGPYATWGTVFQI